MFSLTRSDGHLLSTDPGPARPGPGAPLAVHRRVLGAGRDRETHRPGVRRLAAVRRLPAGDGRQVGGGPGRSPTGPPSPGSATCTSTRAARGRGLGGWLAGAVRDHLAELGVRRILLATNDAHEVYARVGFTPLDEPQRWMQLDRRPPVTPVTGKEQSSGYAPYGGGVTPLRLGYLYGLGAYLLWGFFPLYLKLLRPAGPLEILAHRIVWSVVFVALLLAALRNVGFLRGAAAPAPGGWPGSSSPPR